MFSIRHVSYIGYEECECKICQTLIQIFKESNSAWIGAELIFQIKKPTKENEEWLYG